MGWAFVRRRMATELGPDWQSKFARVRAGGRVRRLAGPGPSRDRCTDGREVACKLQYPDMASAVEADLAQLKLIFAVCQRFDPAIDTDEIHEEIATRLREELDYQREARHVALYRHMLRDEPDVHVPEARAATTRPTGCSP